MNDVSLSFVAVGKLTSLTNLNLLAKAGALDKHIFRFEHAGIIRFKPGGRTSMYISNDGPECKISGHWTTNFIIAEY